ESIACATSLRRGIGDPPDWRILRGSVLDPELLGGISPGSRVYSWGVLHHTGAMWDAVSNVTQLVAPGGLLCLALYNWPHRAALHLRLKRLYNRAPGPGRWAMRGAYGLGTLGAVLMLRRKNPL